MHRPERLMLDWILAVSTGKFGRDDVTAMDQFGLTKNQQEVLLTQNPLFIRKWVAYELGLYSTGPVTHIAAAVSGTHGLPPPPPPLLDDPAS
jgi:hypothetical protein